MKEHIVIFGAGFYAKKILPKVEEYYHIVAVSDNCQKLWGELFEDRYLIISVDKLEDNYIDLMVLIAVNNYEDYMSISSQLTLRGVRCIHVNEGIYKECAKRNSSFFVEDKMISEIKKINTKKRNIFVLTAPDHSNLGDQAQSYCIELVLKKNYPDSNIFIYDEWNIVKNFFELLYIICQWIKEEDRIFLHSGYRLTNLYKVSEYIVEMMTTLYRGRKMVFLPQTLNYTNIQMEDRISQMIDENITIMCRDVVSYKKARELFQQATVFLYPDMVTSLIGRYDFNYVREGVLFVLRNSDDEESLLDESAATDIMKSVGEIENIDITDTTIPENWEEIARNRKYYVEKEIKKYATYKLVVTNRYHGVIFSLIANTPVIILPTKDHKITAGLMWFREAGYEHFYLCENKEQIYCTAKKILESNVTIKNTPYLYEKYYKNIMFEKFFE